jgi:hypothetical protein
MAYGKWKMSSTMVKGKMKNIFNYGRRGNGKYPQLWEQGKRKISLTMAYGKWKDP